MHNRPAHACIGVSVTLAPRKEAEQKKEAPTPADPPRRKTRRRENKRAARGTHATENRCNRTAQTEQEQIVRTKKQKSDRKILK